LEKFGGVAYIYNHEKILVGAPHVSDHHSTGRAIYTGRWGCKYGHKLIGIYIYISTFKSICNHLIFIYLQLENKHTSICTL